MGSAVGQVPEYIEMVARWCKQYTPHAGDRQAHAQHHRHPPARRARRKRGGADAVSLINTINSIIGVDLDTHGARARPSTARARHGGYCGPAVKPIALNMVAEIARDPETHGLPISGIGGITTWRDAAEFMALGAGTVQVCTAAMTYGFKIVEEMIDGPVELDGREGLRARSTTSSAAPCPTSPTGSTSTSTTSPRRASTRTSASSAAAATSPARTPRTRRSRSTSRRQAPLRGDRRGMRRLQPLRRRLPGRELHHHGAAGRRRDRPAHRQRGVSRSTPTGRTHPNNPMAQGGGGVGAGTG